MWGREAAVGFSELPVSVGAIEGCEEFGGNVEGGKRKGEGEELDAVLHRLWYRISPTRDNENVCAKQSLTWGRPDSYIECEGGMPGLKIPCNDLKYPH